MRVAFNDLPQPVRQRFVGIASRPDAPGALLTATHGYFRWVAPFFAVVALAGTLYAMSFEVNEAFGKAPYHDREVYLGIAGMLFVLFAAGATTVFQFVWKKPPYLRGAYLFPSYLVVVHGADLDIVPLHQIGKPTIVSRYRNGAYMGSHLELVDASAPRGARATFNYRSKEAAESAANTFFGARDRMQRLLAARDGNGIAQIDPFHECTISGQWTEPPGVAKAGPLVDRVPPAASWGRWLGSLGLAVAITGVFYVSMVAVCTASPKAQRYCAQDRYRSGPCCY
jgi:hypothetical protein